LASISSWAFTHCNGCMQQGWRRWEMPLMLSFRSTIA
jgi:hypothetical protein